MQHYLYFYNLKGNNARIQYLAKLLMCENNKKKISDMEELGKHTSHLNTLLEKKFYFKPVQNNGAGTRDQELNMRKLL